MPPRHLPQNDEPRRVWQQTDQQPQRDTRRTASRFGQLCTGLILQSLLPIQSWLEPTHCFKCELSLSCSRLLDTPIPRLQYDLT